MICIFSRTLRKIANGVQNLCRFVTQQGKPTDVQVTPAGGAVTGEGQGMRGPLDLEQLQGRMAELRWEEGAGLAGRESNGRVLQSAGALSVGWGLGDWLPCAQTDARCMQLSPWGEQGSPHMGPLSLEGTQGLGGQRQGEKPWRTGPCPQGTSRLYWTRGQEREEPGPPHRLEAERDPAAKVWTLPMQLSICLSLPGPSPGLGSMPLVA